jgi:hypothetical protein
LLMRNGDMLWQCKLVLRSRLMRIQHFVVIFKMWLQCELSHELSFDVDLKLFYIDGASPINSLLISFCGFWIL